jgi:hypothetical protein
VSRVTRDVLTVSCLQGRRSRSRSRSRSRGRDREHHERSRDRQRDQGRDRDGGGRGRDDRGRDDRGRDDRDYRPRRASSRERYSSDRASSSQPWQQPRRPDQSVATSSGYRRDDDGSTPVDEALVEDLLLQRVRARAARDFDSADGIKTQLKNLGVEVWDEQRCGKRLFGRRFCTQSNRFTETGSGQTCSG